MSGHGRQAVERRSRLGLLGGTFNPPHLGHLACASEALEQLGLDRVELLPVFAPPHKEVAGDPGPKVFMLWGAHAQAKRARIEAAGRGHLVRVERVSGEGKVLIRSEHSRDAQGRLTGWRTVNEKGEVTSHVAQRMGEQGIEEVGSFNADGSPRLHLVADGGNVRYWQQEGDKPTYGSMVPVDEPRKRTTRTYRPGGKFESTVVEFLDDEKMTPQQVSHLDSEGNLTAKIEYEYDFDEMGNWTRRVASVCKGGECVAVQEDRRKITYF